jgi:hypothetical protein
MGALPTKSFDAAVNLCLFVPVVIGFMSSLLRSLATIFGYMAAMGLAMAMAPQLSQLPIDRFKLPPAQAWLVSASCSWRPALRAARYCGLPSAK